MEKLTDNKQGMKTLIAGAVLQLFMGIIYVWSVFVIPVSEFYGWPVADVKLTTSYMLSFFVVGILAGGHLQAKLGAAKVVLIGGLMLSAGMLGAAFVPARAAWLIYVTYGIVGGFGVGAAYNAVISSAQKCFPTRRGFATGVSVCAFGFSTVIFAPLTEILIGRFGLRMTFILLAAVFLAAVLALFSFIRFPANAGANAAASAGLLERPQYTTAQMLGRKEFYFLTLSLMFATSAYFILNPSFKTFAIERGLDPAVGTVIVMITGVANALGRLCVPAMSDRIGREKSAVLIISVTALCAASLIFAQGFAFIAVIALIAFCYGGNSGIYPVLTADHFGIQNVGSNYGAVMVGFALSALTFPMIIGRIDNITLKFLVLAVLAAAGAGLVVLLRGGARRARA